MTIAQIMEEMIEYSKGNIHDIHHFIAVWTYAKTIGELEGLDSETQYILEAAAITHDIACPLCRLKYGNTNGSLQEKEGPALIREFFRDSGLTEERIGRIAYLNGHHHTYTDIDGIDHQILIEADYIVNAAENNSPKEQIQHFTDEIMKTESGKRLIREVFCL